MGEVGNVFRNVGVASLEVGFGMAAIIGYFAIAIAIGKGRQATKIDGLRTLEQVGI